MKVAPPMLMPLQKEMIAQLRAEQGPTRDAAYLAQQRAAHGQALSVQKAYAMDGTAPALRAAATKIARRRASYYDADGNVIGSR
jgi:putative membrane protein